MATPSSPLPVDAEGIVERIAFEIRDGRVETARQFLDVDVGETIELLVRSDVGTTLRVDGLEVHQVIATSDEHVVSITVKDIGDYPVVAGDGLILTTIRSR